MLLRWHGHACFELVTDDGKVIVFDPHDGYSIGIKPPKAQADIVLISHDHFDHNAHAIVAKPGATVLKMSVGEHEVDGLKILGVETYHDKVKGKRRGKNVVYRVQVSDIAFVHCGDLGHIPETSTIEKLKPVDIVMIPVGGTFTIEPDEAWSVIELMEPAIVVPMHYWIEGINLPLKPVDEFLSRAPAKWRIEKLSGNELTLSKPLPKNVVYVFSPPK